MEAIIVIVVIIIIIIIIVTGPIAHVESCPF
jgi:hypothetical protein